jgi:hypothetical protein
LKYFLTILVFVGDMTSLALEMSTSRPLGAYFGISFSIWSCLVTFLGRISLFSIRLMTKNSGNSGLISGSLYAISTMGNLSSHRYFDINEPNLHIYTEDSRTFLATTHAHDDVIAIDTFDQPHTPFQFITHEFFLQLRNQMTNSDTVVMNTTHTTLDYCLVQAFVNTMKQVFSSVYTFNVPNSINTEIMATKEPTSLTTFQHNLAHFSPTSALEQVSNEVLPVVQDGYANEGLIFTDDHMIALQLS